MLAAILTSGHTHTNKHTKKELRKKENDEYNTNIQCKDKEHASPA